MNNTAASSGWWRPTVDTCVSAGVAPHPIGEDKHRLAFWGVIVFTLVMILSPQDYFPILKPLHLALLAGALAGGAYLLGRFSGNADPVHKSPAMVLAALLFLWALALVPFSLWPGGSFAKIFDVFAKALVIFWLLGRVVTSVPRLRIVAWTLCLISIPLSLSAVSAFLQIGAGNVNLTHGWDRISGYNAGLTGNPNDLALMINLTLPFAVGLLLSARRLPVRILLLTIAVLDVIAVVLTYSRGGFLTLVSIISMYLWCLRGPARTRLLVALLALGLVAVPLIPSGYWSRLGTITDIKADQTDSAQERWADMEEATRLVAENPLIGAGAGMDVLALNTARGNRWTHVHNIYLEYAVDLGLPGLLLFLVLYGCLLRNAWLARRKASRLAWDGSFYHLSEAVGVALIAFGVSAFFHPVAYTFYFYYIGGLAVAVSAISADSIPRAPAKDGAKTS